MLFEVETCVKTRASVTVAEADNPSVGEEGSSPKFASAGRNHSRHGIQRHTILRKRYITGYLCLNFFSTLLIRQCQVLG